jgi:hypothetical protein
MVRQKAEFRLEQQQQSSSRRSTLTGTLDEEVLERLQAEVAAADTLSAELQKAKVGGAEGQQKMCESWLGRWELAWPAICPSSCGH